MDAPINLTAVFMLCLIVLGLGIFGMTMTSRMKILLGLAPEDRFDEVGVRLGRLLRFGLGQRRLVDPEEFKPGLAHVLIFAAFMVLAARTITLFGMAFGGWDFHLPLLGANTLSGRL